MRWKKKRPKTLPPAKEKTTMSNANLNIAQVLNEDWILKQTFDRFAAARLLEKPVGNRRLTKVEEAEVLHQAQVHLGYIRPANDNAETANDNAEVEEPAAEVEEPAAKAEEPVTKAKPNGRQSGALRPIFDNFPAELTALPNWVMWQYVQKPGKPKPDKVPCQPNGQFAKTNDSSTWTTFDVCRAAYEHGGFDGIGFVFDGKVGDDDLCLTGVDFDRCIEDGQLKEPAGDRIALLRSYTEVSVSGTGAHSIVRAKPGTTYKNTCDEAGKSLEIYSGGRFFTFTGMPWSETRGTIRSAAPELDAIITQAGGRTKSMRPQGATPVEIFADPALAGEPSMRWKGHKIEPITSGLKDYNETYPIEEVRSAVEFLLSQLNEHTRVFEAEDAWMNLARSFAYQALKCPDQRAELEQLLDELSKAEKASGYNKLDNAERFARYITEAEEREGSDKAQRTMGSFVRWLKETYRWAPKSALPPTDQADATRKEEAEERTEEPKAKTEEKAEAKAETKEKTKRKAKAEGFFDDLKGETKGRTEEKPEDTLPDESELRVDFESPSPHRQWLYGTYLIRGEVTVVASPGGWGKTTMSLAIAIEIAVGVNLLRNHIFGSNLRALYISREEDTKELDRRFKAIDLAYPGEGIRGKAERLLRLGIDKDAIQNVSFTKSNEKGKGELDITGFARLEDLIRAYRPDLLVLDPLVLFCPGDDMNSPLMGHVISSLKRLAAAYKCAILVVHHTSKAGEAGDVKSVFGASAITNISRRTFLPVRMTETEAPKLGVLPSDMWRYFRIVDAKANQAPPINASTWYKLLSVELPNPEPPIYERGDNVQAMQRVYLPLMHSETTGDLATKRAILDLIERGKLIDGESYPYSGSVVGSKNERSLLPDAIEAVRKAVAPTTYELADLKAIARQTIDNLTSTGWVSSAAMKELKPGSRRFRDGMGLKVDWLMTPWPNGPDGGDGADQ
jgi:hypothetical protein